MESFSQLQEEIILDLGLVKTDYKIDPDNNTQFYKHPNSNLKFFFDFEQEFIWFLTDPKNMQYIEAKNYKYIDTTELNNA